MEGTPYSWATQLQHLYAVLRGRQTAEQRAQTRGGALHGISVQTHKPKCVLILAPIVRRKNETGENSETEESSTAVHGPKQDCQPAYRKRLLALVEEGFEAGPAAPAYPPALADRQEFPPALPPLRPPLR